RDHLGGGVVDEIIQVVDSPGDGFIAGGNGKADAEAAQIGKDGDADGAALGDKADIPGQPPRIHDCLLVGGDARRRIENTHAIGPTDRHCRLAAKPGDLLLQGGTVIAELGKTAIVDDGSARAAIHGTPDLLGNERLSYAEDDDV